MPLGTGINVSHPRDDAIYIFAVADLRDEADLRDTPYRLAMRSIRTFKIRSS